MSLVYLFCVERPVDDAEVARIVSTGQRQKQLPPSPVLLDLWIATSAQDLQAASSLHQRLRGDSTSQLQPMSWRESDGDVRRWLTAAVAAASTVSGADPPVVNLRRILRRERGVVAIVGPAQLVSTALEVLTLAQPLEQPIPFEHGALAQLRLVQRQQPPAPASESAPDTDLEVEHLYLQPPVLLADPAPAPA